MLLYARNLSRISKVMKHVPSMAKYLFIIGVVLTISTFLFSAPSESTLMAQISLLRQENQMLKKNINNCNNLQSAIRYLTDPTGIEKQKYLLSTLYEDMECARRQVGRTTTFDNIVFGIVTGKKNLKKAKAVRDTWAKDLNVYFFSDTADPSMNILTSAQTEGKKGYEESQLKFFHALKWSYAQDPEKANHQWFFLGDDDTWVNTPALLRFASKFNHEMPVMFCFVWDRDVYHVKHCSGGGGTLLSSAAVDRIGKAFHDGICDKFSGPSDTVIAECAKESRTRIIHSSLFHPWDPEMYENDLQKAPFSEAVTYHYVEPKHMPPLTQLALEKWKEYLTWVSERKDDVK